MNCNQTSNKTELKMKSGNYTYIILTMLISFMGVSQEKEYTGDPDASFLVARTLAYNNKRAVARDTLKKILTKYPTYTDVQNLLAKTLTWDKKYDEARLHYNTIITREKDNEEVWVAAINNEFYSKNYNTALGLSNKGLHYLKGNENLIMLRNKAIANINTIKKKEVNNEELKNGISFSKNVDFFNKVYDPMYYASLSYKRATKYGAIIPQINYSNRFDVNGLQFQLDAYPKISKTLYAYASYAFSNSSIYPNHKIDVEIHTSSLPFSLEASLGIRYFQFTPNETVILTGSVGWYTGNYYLSWRPYVNPNSGGSISFSNNFSIRKYLKDKYNYLSLSFGFGFSPETTQLRENNVLLSESLFYLESQNILLGYNFTLKNSSNLFTTTFGVTRQELIFNPGNFYLAISGGLSYQFKW